MCFCIYEICIMKIMSWFLCYKTAICFTRNIIISIAEDFKLPLSELDNSNDESAIISREIMLW